MGIYYEHLPFTIDLSLRMVWQISIEVKEQSRLESSKMFLERVTCVLNLLLLLWRRENVRIFSGGEGSVRVPAAGKRLDIASTGL